MIGNQITVTGRAWKKLDAPTFAASVSLFTSGGTVLGTANVNQTDGSFVLTVAVNQAARRLPAAFRGGRRSSRGCPAAGIEAPGSLQLDEPSRRRQARLGRPEVLAAGPGRSGHAGGEIDIDRG